MSKDKTSKGNLNSALRKTDVVSWGGYLVGTLIGNENRNKKKKGSDGIFK